jgi:hypothetical protein
VSVKNWFTGPIKQVEEPVEPVAPAEPVAEPT